MKVTKSENCISLSFVVVFRRTTKLLLEDLAATTGRVSVRLCVSECVCVSVYVCSIESLKPHMVPAGILRDTATVGLEGFPHNLKVSSSS